MAELSLVATVTGDCCVLAITGEIDAHTAPEIVAAASAQLEQFAVERLVLDLSSVSFLDSTGIAALVRTRNKGLDLGKDLVLRNPGPRVVRVLKITALDTIFLIERTDEAT